MAALIQPPLFKVMKWLVAVFLALIGSLTSQAKLTPEQVASLPKSLTRPVTFREDVKPILEASCVKCHARGQSKGGFGLETREQLLRGGDSGAAVVPGKSAESYLVELVAGVDPDNVMPQKGSKLTSEQVGILRKWIDDGVPWDAEVTFAKPPPVNLHSLRPELPKGEGNPIDLLLADYLSSNRVQRAKPVDDRLFARRVYLDVIGLLPSTEELQAFVNDKSPNKRARLVRRLLADKQRYAEHWLTFWNDMLRNDYRGTGYIDGGRKQISAWLFSALATNMPYDQFVTQLIHPTAESEGFVKGIVWRGVVNASQTPEMQAAQNISQVFMGVNLKCASCHDSFINDWTLADAYALANVYSDRNLELFQCDKPTGKQAAMRFIYPELGDIDGNASKRDRQKQLAEILAGPKNGRLTRTIVNRLWARFMGRGLVEPVDDMETPAWHSGALDWLAEDLVANAYDLKHTIELMLTSDVYQWPAVAAAEQAEKTFVFRGPAVRRISAEQFVDAIGCLTDIWHDKPDGDFDFSVIGGNSGKLSRDVKWIWSRADAASAAPPGRAYFRKTVVLKDKPARASAIIACDNSFTFYVNGHEAASGKDYNRPVTKDVTRWLKAGTNVLAALAINHTPENKVPGEDKPVTEGANPAGLYVHLGVIVDGSERVIGTDQSWVATEEKAENWNKPEFGEESWPTASELGGVSIAPWKMGKALTSARAALALNGRVRSSLVTADPLTVALGRPNREQVITSRASAATTLQALELTNGRTLTSMIRDGAAKLAASKGRQTPAEVITELYAKAFGRKPTASEQKLAEQTVGDPVQKEGVEDLLWAMIMLPEFQLIY
jgi:hypothetical protein